MGDFRVLERLESNGGVESWALKDRPNFCGRRFSSVNFGSWNGIELSLKKNLGSFVEFSCGTRGARSGSARRAQNF
jgi:hypothetical protein